MEIVLRGTSLEGVLLRIGDDDARFRDDLGRVRVRHQRWEAKDVARTARCVAGIDTRRPADGVLRLGLAYRVQGRDEVAFGPVLGPDFRGVPPAAPGVGAEGLTLLGAILHGDDAEVGRRVARLPCGGARGSESIRDGPQFPPGRPSASRRSPRP